MVSSLRVEDRLGGTTNFRSWKTRILFNLDENDIHNYMKDVLEPKSDEEKTKHKKHEATAKRILINYVKDHLIPHIAKLKAAKAMHDSLVGLVESKNTNNVIGLEESTQLYHDAKPRLNCYLFYESLTIERPV